MGQLAGREYTKEQLEDIYDNDAAVLLRKPREQKVAILGSYDHFILMDHIAKLVAKNGHYAVTSRQVYIKDCPETSPKTIKREHVLGTEGMNEFLLSLIADCKCAIIIYAGAGGQFIDTSWCARVVEKPTLRILPLRPPDFLDSKACAFLTYSEDYRLFSCRGQKKDKNDAVDSFVKRRRAVRLYKLVYQK